MFNNRVTAQIKLLEKAVMGEISALSVELSKEEVRRAESDKFLLDQVNSFFDNLKRGYESYEDQVWKPNNEKYLIKNLTIKFNQL